MKDYDVLVDWPNKCSPLFREVCDQRLTDERSKHSDRQVEDIQALDREYKHARSHLNIRQIIYH